jgi:hypothetical protein
MADRKNPFIQIGFPEYAGVHMMPFGMLERAIKHEVERQRVVASIILELNLMAVVGVLKKDVKVSLGGAHFQSLKGEDANATEAAHCAPRQILLNGRPADEAFSNAADGFRLKVMFGETDILPVNFNKCDSRAERKGLAEGFQKACESSIKSGLFGGTLEPGSIAVSSVAAFSIYSYFANLAFTSSITRMKEKLRPANIAHRDRVNWTEQLFILEKYIETLGKGAGRSEALSFSRISGLIVVYKMIQKEISGK